MINAWQKDNSSIVSKKTLIRVVALITLVAFVLTMDGGILTDIAHASNLPSNSANSFNARLIKLPEYLGHIKESHNTFSERIVIHIQDAHCNYAAQKKIADIIRYLNDTYAIDTANLEGGKGNYDLSPFSGISDKAVREKISDHFVKEGLINGAEYFAINSPNQVKLWGIEDEGLYVRNLNVYRDAIKHKKEADKYINELGQALTGLKRHIYSEELLKLDGVYSEFKEQEIELRDYLAYLFNKADERSIDIKAFPNLYLLNQAIREERKIDFEKADKERTRLINRLENKLSRYDIEELLLKMVEFKEERITQDSFYRYLARKARLANISLEGSPELRKYIIYVSIYNSLDEITLYEEIEALEGKIQQSLCENETQLELYELSRNFALTKNILDFSITSNDYRYYKDNQKLFKVKNYISFIGKYSPRYKITAKVDNNLRDLDRYRDEAIKFYEYSFERDKAFIKNLKWSQAKDQGRQITILITGGFHSENLTGLLKEKGISFISIAPNFKCEEGYESPYFDLLSGGKGSLVKLIETSTSGLAMHSLLSEMEVIDIDKEGIKRAIEVLEALEKEGSITLPARYGSVTFSREAISDLSEEKKRMNGYTVYVTREDIQREGSSEGKEDKRALQAIEKDHIAKRIINRTFGNARAVSGLFHPLSLILLLTAPSLFVTKIAFWILISATSLFITKEILHYFGLLDRDKTKSPAWFDKLSFDFAKKGMVLGMVFLGFMAFYFIVSPGSIIPNYMTWSNLISGRNPIWDIIFTGGVFGLFILPLQLFVSGMSEGISGLFKEAITDRLPFREKKRSSWHSEEEAAYLLICYAPILEESARFINIWAYLYGALYVLGLSTQSSILFAIVASSLHFWATHCSHKSLATLLEGVFLGVLTVFINNPIVNYASHFWHNVFYGGASSALSRDGEEQGKPKSSPDETSVEVEKVQDPTADMIEAIIELHKANDQMERISEEELTQHLKNPESIIFIAKDAKTEKVVGCFFGVPQIYVPGTVYLERPDTVRIKNQTFYEVSGQVLPNYQGKGIGTALRRELRDEVRYTGRFQYIACHQYKSFDELKLIKELKKYGQGDKLHIAINTSPQYIVIKLNPADKDNKPAPTLKKKIRRFLVILVMFFTLGYYALTSGILSNVNGSRQVVHILKAAVTWVLPSGDENPQERENIDGNMIEESEASVTAEPIIAHKEEYGIEVGEEKEAGGKDAGKTAGLKKHTLKKMFKTVLRKSLSALKWLACVVLIGSTPKDEMLFNPSEETYDIWRENEADPSLLKQKSSEVDDRLTLAPLLQKKTAADLRKEIHKKLVRKRFPSRIINWIFPYAKKQFSEKLYRSLNSLKDAHVYKIHLLLEFLSKEENVRSILAELKQAAKDEKEAGGVFRFTDGKVEFCPYPASKYLGNKYHMVGIKDFDYKDLLFGFHSHPPAAFGWGPSQADVDMSFISDTSQILFYTDGLSSGRFSVIFFQAYNIDGEFSDYINIHLGNYSYSRKPDSLSEETIAFLDSFPRRGKPLTPSSNIGNLARMVSKKGSIATIENSEGELHEVKLEYHGKLNVKRIKREFDFADYVWGGKKELLFMFLDLVEPLKPSIYYFDGSAEKIEDLSAFSSFEYGLLAFHPNLASNLLAQLHEIGHYLIDYREGNAKKGLLDLKYKRTDEEEFIIVRARETVSDKLKVIRKIHLSPDTSWYIQNEDWPEGWEEDPHYLLRVLFREIFDEVDQDLTEDIKYLLQARKINSETGNKKGTSGKTTLRMGGMGIAAPFAAHLAGLISLPVAFQLIFAITIISLVSMILSQMTAFDDSKLCDVNDEARENRKKEYISKKAINELKANYGLLPKEHKLSQYIKDLLREIYPELSDEELPKVEVLASRGYGVNAMVFPNNTIVITPELLEFAEYKEELIHILFHEIVHMDREHFKRDKNAGSIRELLGLMRYDEYEADMAAFRMLQDKGFNPQGAISMMKKFRDAFGKYRLERELNVVHGEETDRLLNMESLTYLEDYKDLSFSLTPLPKEVWKGASRDGFIRSGNRRDLILNDSYPIEDRMRLIFQADQYLLQEILGELCGKIILSESELRKLGRDEDDMTSAIAVQLSEQRMLLKKAIERLKEILEEKTSGENAKVLNFTIVSLIFGVPFDVSPETLRSGYFRDIKGDFYEQLDSDPEAVIESIERLLTNGVMEKLDLVIDGNTLSSFLIGLSQAAAERGLYDKDEGFDFKMYLKNSFRLLEGGAFYAGREGMGDCGCSCCGGVFNKSVIWTRIVFRGLWEIFDLGQVEEGIFEEDNLFHYFKEVNEYKGSAQVNRELLTSFASSSREVDIKKMDSEIKRVGLFRKDIEEENERVNELTRYLLGVKDSTDELKKQKVFEDTLTDQGLEVAGKLRAMSTKTSIVLANYTPKEKAQALRNVQEIDPIQAIEAFQVMENHFTGFKNKEDFIALIRFYCVFSEGIGHEYSSYRSELRSIFTYLLRDVRFPDPDHPEIKLDLDDLEDIAKAVSDVETAEKELGVSAVSQDLNVSAEDIPMFRDLLFEVLYERLSEIEDPDTFFTVLKDFLNRWPLVGYSEMINMESQYLHIDPKPILDPGEVKSRYEGIVKKGIRFIGSSGPVSGDDPEVLERLMMVSFFLKDMFIKSTVQEDLAMRITENMDFEDALDFTENSYHPQNPSGFLSCWEYLIEEKARTTQQLDILGEKIFNILSVDSEGMAKTFGNIAGFDWLSDRVFDDKLFSLLALMESGQSDQNLRSYLFSKWYDKYKKFIDPAEATEIDSGELEEWASENPETVMQEVTRADYDIGKLYFPLQKSMEQLYRMGFKSKYVLLRKLLAGRNGVLRLYENRKLLLNDFLKSSVSFEDGGKKAEEVITDILSKFFEEAEEDQLYFMLNPILMDRIGVPPREPTPWHDIPEVKDEFHEIVDYLSHYDVFPKAGMDEVETAVTKRLLTWIYGYTPKDLDESVLEESEDPDDKFLSLAGTSTSGEGIEQLTSIGLILQVAKRLGAPGVRFLQLLGQFIDLPDEYSDEFMDVYDSMVGQSRLSAYQLLKRECPEYVKRIKKFKPRVGGGSLMTVYEVELDDGAREVVKVRNPNARYFAERSIELLEKVLRELSEEDERYEQALALLDDLREWIEGDLTDDAFAENDKIFRKTNDGYKPKKFNYKIRVFESHDSGSPYVIRERFVEGTDLTRINDTDLHQDERKEIAGLIIRNYLDQIKGSLLKGTALVHADVHPGNFRVTGDKEVAILDRSSYIELTLEDRLLVNSLAKAGNIEERLKIFLKYLAKQEGNQHLKDAKEEEKIRSFVLSKLDTNKKDLEKAVLDIIVHLKRRNVKIPLKITLLVKNLHILSKWAKDAGFDSLQEAAEFNPKKQKGKADSTGKTLHMKGIATILGVIIGFVVGMPALGLGIGVLADIVFALPAGWISVFIKAVRKEVKYFIGVGTGALITLLILMCVPADHARGSSGLVSEPSMVFFGDSYKTGIPAARLEDIEPEPLFGQEPEERLEGPGDGKPYSTVKIGFEEVRDAYIPLRNRRSGKNADKNTLTAAGNLIDLVLEHTDIDMSDEYRKNVKFQLIMTMMVESDQFAARFQYGGGPNRGLAQLNPRDAGRIIDYVDRRSGRELFKNVLLKTIGEDWQETILDKSVDEITAMVQGKAGAEEKEKAEWTTRVGGFKSFLIYSKFKVLIAKALDADWSSITAMTDQEIAQKLADNDLLTAVMSRAYYFMSPGLVPDRGDLEAVYEYYLATWDPDPPVSMDRFKKMAEVVNESGIIEGPSAVIVKTAAEDKTKVVREAVREKTPEDAQTERSIESAMGKDIPLRNRTAERRPSKESLRALAEIIDIILEHTDREMTTEYKENVKNQIIMTIMVESDQLAARQQYKGGPARGLAQFEPLTAEYVRDYIGKRSEAGGFTNVVKRVFGENWEEAVFTMSHEEIIDKLAQQLANKPDQTPKEEKKLIEKIIKGKVRNFRSFLVYSRFRFLIIKALGSDWGSVTAMSGQELGDRMAKGAGRDVFAITMSRANYFRDPRLIPDRRDTEAVYRYYLENWRPGKPVPFSRFRDLVRMVNESGIFKTEEVVTPEPFETQEMQTEPLVPAAGSWFSDPEYARKKAWWIETLISFGVGTVTALTLALAGLANAIPLTASIAAAVTFWLPHLLFDNKKAAFDHSVLSLSLVTWLFSMAAFLPVYFGAALPISIGAVVFSGVSLALMHRKMNLGIRAIPKLFLFIILCLLSRGQAKADEFEDDLQFMPTFELVPDGDGDPIPKIGFYFKWTFGGDSEDYTYYREKRPSLDTWSRVGLTSLLVLGTHYYDKDAGDTRPYLYANVLSSALLGTFGSWQHDQDILDNTIYGGLAGLTMYAGKRFTGDMLDEPGYWSFLGRPIHSVGVSMRNNILIGEAPFSRLEFDFGPALFSFVPKDDHMDVGFCLLPYPLWGMSHGLVSGGKIDWRSTFKVGALVFEGNKSDPYLAGAAGVAIGNVIFRRPDSYFEGREEFFKPVLYHEFIHTTQYNDLSSLWYFFMHLSDVDRKGMIDFSRNYWLRIDRLAPWGTGMLWNWHEKSQDIEHDDMLIELETTAFEEWYKDSHEIELPWSHHFRFPKYIWDEFERRLIENPEISSDVYKQVKINGLAWRDARSKLHWLDEMIGEEDFERVLTQAKDAINAVKKGSSRKVADISEVRDVVLYHELIHSSFHDVKYKELIKGLWQKLYEKTGPLHENHPFITAFRKVYGEPHGIETTSLDRIGWYLEEFLTLSIQEKNVFNDEYAVINRMDYDDPDFLKKALTEVLDTKIARDLMRFLPEKAIKYKDGTSNAETKVLPAEEDPRLSREILEMIRKADTVRIQIEQKKRSRTKAFEAEEARTTKGRGKVKAFVPPQKRSLVDTAVFENELARLGVVEMKKGKYHFNIIPNLKMTPDGEVRIDMEKALRYKDLIAIPESLSTENVRIVQELYYQAVILELKARRTEGEQATSLLMQAEVMRAKANKILEDWEIKPNDAVVKKNLEMIEKKLAPYKNVKETAKFDKEKEKKKVIKVMVNPNGEIVDKPGTLTQTIEIVFDTWDNQLELPLKKVHINLRQAVKYYNRANTPSAKIKFTTTVIDKIKEEEAEQNFEGKTQIEPFEDNLPGTVMNSSDTIGKWEEVVPVKLSKKTGALEGIIMNIDTKETIDLSRVSQTWLDDPNEMVSYVNRVENYIQQASPSPEEGELLQDIIRQFKAHLPERIVIVNEGKKGFFGTGKENFIIIDETLLNDDPEALLHEISEYLKHSDPEIISRMENLLDHSKSNKYAGGVWLDEKMAKYEAQGRLDYFIKNREHYVIRAFIRQVFKDKDVELTRAIKESYLTDNGTMSNLKGIDLKSMIGEKLLSAFTELNNGKRPQIINVSGQYEDVAAEQEKKMKDIPDDEYVIVTLSDSIQSFEYYVDYYRIAVDKAGIFRDRHFKKLWEENGDLGRDFEFVFSFRIFQNLSVEIGDVAVGKHKSMDLEDLKRVDELRGKGIVSEAFSILAKRLEEDLGGKNIVTRSLEETEKEEEEFKIIPHLMRKHFDAQKVGYNTYIGKIRTRIDPELPALTSLEEEEGERELKEYLTDLVSETAQGSMQDLMDGGEVIFNIPLNPEMAGVTDEVRSKFYNRIYEARRLSNDLVQTFNLGNIMINFFEESAEGRSELLARMQKAIGKWGDITIEDKKRRVITFSFEKSEEIERESFVVYLEGAKKGEKTATPTPISACVAAGIRIVNLFDLTRSDREAKPDKDQIEDAVRKAARGIVALSGSINKQLLDSLVARIQKEGLLELSGKLFVKIRPINWGEVILYHEAEAEALRSL